MTVVELLGAVAGGGTLSAIIGAVGVQLAARRQERVDSKKEAATIEVSHTEAATEALGLMSALIGEMRGERARLIDEAEKARARTEEETKGRHECLALVSELRGHVDQLEPRLQVMEAAHDKCREDLAEFKASVKVELAKRPASNPGFPKVGG